MDRTLSPETAEDLFANFLQLKTNHVLTGKCFPSVQDIKQSLTLRLFALTKKKDEKRDTKKTAPPKNTKTVSKPVTPKPTVAAQGARFCQEFNNSTCPRQPADAVYCSINNLTLLHACNKKVLGKSCGERHTRRDCTK